MLYSGTHTATVSVKGLTCIRVSTFAARLCRPRDCVEKNDIKCGGGAEKNRRRLDWSVDDFNSMQFDSVTTKFDGAGVAGVWRKRNTSECAVR